MEIELKLLLQTDDIAALKNHPIIRRHAQSPAVTQQQTAIYFDTPDCLLRQHDAGLRVRKSGNDWTQSMKAGGTVTGGLHRRHEWETGVPGPKPDLYALRKAIGADGPWRDLIASPKTARALAPIFTTSIQRTSWDLTLPQGDVAELVLDQGTVESGDNSEPVCEIELELKSGNHLHLFDLALALLEDIPMRLGNESKAARGYALYSGAEHLAVKAKSLELKPRMTIEQAFEAIVENCLEQIQANEPGVADAGDIESLHQMRVGLRRLKSALGLFSDAIALPEELQADLDWLSEQVAAARDWDVLATSTLKTIKPAELENIDEIKKAAAEKAGAMHKVATAAIHSTRYARFILGMLRWLGGREWRRTPPQGKGKGLKRHLKPFSSELLEHDQQRLTNRGRKLQGADPRKRHRMRIATKKMRYDTEFFASLYSPEEMNNYVKALAKLQDQLGWLNDVAVGERLLLKLQSDEADLASAAGFIRGYLAARAAKDEKKVEKLWKKFKAKHLSKN